MKVLLIALCLTVLAIMLVVTTWASLDRNVLRAGEGLWPDPWFAATLADAYCGFLTFYVWVAYRETSMRARLIWFVLIMTLGNFAMSGYVLRILVTNPTVSWEALLLRPERIATE